MKLCFVDESWDDYHYWQETDRKTLNKINCFIKDIVHRRMKELESQKP